MTARHHYHVGHNIAGYLPEADVYTVSNLRDAIHLSSSDARRHVDDSYEYAFDGETPARLTGRAGDYWVNDGRTLDTHYWVSDPCDCAEGAAELDGDA